VQCENFQGSDNIGTPETALNCANAAGIDWENGKAGQCAGKDGRGTEGIQLLQQSARDSITAEIQYVLEPENPMETNPAIGKAARSSSMVDKYAYGMALGIIARYSILPHNVQDLTTCSQGGHSPADFIRQINEEYDRLNSVD
jgi:hypothetical protein